MTEQVIYALFEEFKKRYFEMHPTEASELGFHQFDTETPDFSPETIESYLAYIKTVKKQLETIDDTNYSEDARYTKDMMLWTINSDIYELEIQKSHEKNPMIYLFTALVMGQLLKNYAPDHIRGKIITEKLEATPKFFEHAKQTLKPPIPEPLKQLSIQMYTGIIHFYDSDVLPEGKKLITDPQMQQRFLKALENAKNATKDMLEFIKQLETTTEFALGKEKYMQMLEMKECLPISLEHLEEIALQDLQHNKNKLLELLKQYQPDKTPHQALHDIKQDYPDPDNLITETQNLLEDLRTMIITKNIVTVPSEVRAQVIPSPTFFKAFAFAAMSAPGTFEEIASEAHYFISEPEPTWPEEQVKEWMTVFSRPMLEDISVHEAYPGHYLHFLHVKYKTKHYVSKFWSSYHFVEGWAHYVEELIYHETDWRQNDIRYKIAQLIEALIRNARFLASIYLHTKPEYTVQDATKLFMEHAFMEEKPAYTEAMRGTFDPGYLNYTLGKLLIKKLREDYKNEHPNDFSLKAFHDTILSYGATPVPLLRKYLLKNNTPPL